MFLYVRQSLFASFLFMGLVPTAKAQLTYYTNLTTFSSASNTNLVEDFESILPKDAFFSSLAHNGITYTGVPNVGVASPGYTNFGVPITTSSVLTANGDEDITLAFGTPGSAVGFDTYTNNFGPVRIEIFGTSGLLDTYSLTQSSTQVGFFGVIANQPITSIRWTSVNGRAINTGVDNIRIGSVVPAPSALAAFLIGAVPSIGLLLRRRRRA